MTSELNPNHPVARELREQWHKICALLMIKFGVSKIDITIEDIDHLALRRAGSNIAVHLHGSVITLEMVSDEEAKRLAYEEGGLPI